MEFTTIVAHPGSPSCERCIVEIQVEHARERAAALPELERRLTELGGPAERELCGYVMWLVPGDTAKFGDFCEAPMGHDGFHSPEHVA